MIKACASVRDAMTDTERILQALLHDVRTPLGVAQGYLRLLREQRLETPEERERALSGASEALGRISRLCDEAGRELAARTEAPPA
jgi:signal transduction histidine kinase